MEGLPVWRVSKQANPGDFPRRLSVGYAQRGEEAEGEGDERPDRAARHGSVLKNARKPRTREERWARVYRGLKRLSMLQDHRLTKNDDEPLRLFATFSDSG
jgi:hypothetical protein